MNSIYLRCLAIFLLLGLHAGCEAATSRDREGESEKELDAVSCTDDAIDTSRGFEKDGLFHLLTTVGEEAGDRSNSAVRLYDFSNKKVCEQVAKALTPEDVDAFGPLADQNEFETTRSLASGEEIEIAANEFKILRVKDQTYRKVNRCRGGDRTSKSRRRSRGSGWSRVGEAGELTCVYPRSWSLKTTQIALAFDSSLENFRPACEKTSPFDSRSCVSRRAAVGGVVKMTYPRSLSDAQPMFQLAWHIGSPSDSEILARLQADPNLKFSKSAQVKFTSVAQNLRIDDKVPVRAIGFAETPDPGAVRIWGLTTPHIRESSGLQSPYSVAQLPIRIFGGTAYEKIDAMINEKIYRQSTAMMGWNARTLKREPNGTGDEDSLSTEWDRVFTSTVDANRPFHVILVWTADEMAIYFTDVQIESSGQIRSVVTKRVRDLSRLNLPLDLLQQ